MKTKVFRTMLASVLALFMAGGNISAAVSAEEAEIGEETAEEITAESVDEEETDEQEEDVVQTEEPADVTEEENDLEGDPVDPEVQKIDSKGEVTYISTFVKAAQNWSNGDKLVLLKDADAGDNTFTVNGGERTIDLNSHSLTYKGSGTLFTVNYFLLNGGRGTLNIISETEGDVDNGVIISETGRIANVTDSRILGINNILNVRGAGLNGVSDGNGGVILVSGGTVNLEDATLLGESKKNGGAVYIEAGGELHAEKSDILGKAAQNGGAVYVSEDTMMEINSTLLSGHAQNGGAVYAKAGVSGFSSRTSQAHTARVILNNSRVMLSQAVKAGKTGGNGAGIYLEGAANSWVSASAELELNNTVLSNNYADEKGGAIYIDRYGIASLNGEGETAAKITDNSANVNGGGVYLALNGNFHMGESSLVCNNQVIDAGTGAGGGIYTEAGSAPDGESRFTVTQNAVVKDNFRASGTGEEQKKTADNIFLMKGNVVTAEGLSDGACFGLTSESNEDSGAVLSNQLEDESWLKYFFSDNDAFETDLNSQKAVILSEVKYDLWVSDIRVTGLNRNNVMKDSKASVQYDHINHVLTLNGASLMPMTKEVGTEQRCGIYSGLKSLEIHLNNTSTILSAGDSEEAQKAMQSGDFTALDLVSKPENNTVTYGIYSEGNLFFSGEGALGIMLADGYGIGGVAGTTLTDSFSADTHNRLLIYTAGGKVFDDKVAFSSKKGACFMDNDGKYYTYVVDETENLNAYRGFIYPFELKVYKFTAGDQSVYEKKSAKDLEFTINASMFDADTAERMAAVTADGKNLRQMRIRQKPQKEMKGLCSP